MVDPANVLAAAFRRIAATRMAGLPMNRPDLAIETVGFRPWQGKQVGVLILPWAINLVVLPDTDEKFRPLRADQRQCWRFPSGDYDFMGGSEVECGSYHFCSLLSPVPSDEISGPIAALEFATQAMVELFQPAGNEVAQDAREQARLQGLSVLASPLSRRGFILGGRAG
ncbi:MAG: [NiFe]-hydrogenase assembly chaperone HybE [Proteobacteria bacterium]|nr:[NiFe]-hydrogenase assembly chaperone HybE [Pseudomonadota bacterium]